VILSVLVTFLILNCNYSLKKVIRKLHDWFSAKYHVTAEELGLFTGDGLPMFLFAPVGMNSDFLGICN
jgi:hypothetical protein